MSVNQSVSVGRLTKDPELRYSPSGTPIVRFTVAVNRSFKREGEQEADFIGCVAFNKTAESLANFQKKGNLIAVVGRIQTGSYEGQDGKRIYTTDVIANEIQFLEPRSNDNAQNGGQQQQYNAPQQQYNAPLQQQYGQQPQYQQNQPNYQNGGQSNQPPQQNYSRVDEDPFANSKGPIEVDEDSLPF